MKEMIFSRLPYICTLVSILPNMKRKIDCCIGFYPRIIGRLLLCLTNDMLTYIICFITNFAFCMRFLDVNPTGSVRTERSNVLSQWVPCYSLNIMGMSVQYLMHRSWERIIDISIRKKTTISFNVSYDNSMSLPLVMSQIMQELSTDPETRKVPSLDHWRSRTSFRWNLC